MTDTHDEQAEEMQPEREWSATDPVRIESVTSGYDAGYRAALRDVRAAFMDGGRGWLKILSDLESQAGA